MSNRKTLRALLGALGLSAVLGGCGGGGASDSATPTRELPLALAAGNVREVAELAVGYGESGLRVGQLAHEWVQALRASAGAPVVLACDGGGNLQLRLVDVDGSRGPTPGDQIGVTLARCYLRSFDDILDGTLSLDLTQPANSSQQEAGTLTFGPRLTLPDPDVPIQFQGSLRYEFGSDRLGSRMRVYAGPSDYSISAASAGRVVADIVTGLDATKTVRRDQARTISTLKLRVASDVAGGSFEVTTGAPLEGWFNTPPDAGRLVVTGAAGPSLAIAAINGNTSALGLTFGAVATTVPLSLASTGYLWWAAGVTAQGTGNRGYTTQIAADGFRLLTRPAQTLAQRPAPLVWQYSRPLDAARMTTTARLDLSRSALGYAWAGNSVDCTIQIEGAVITVTPLGLLQPGAGYRLATNGGNAVQQGTGAMIDGPYLEAQVPDTITATASVAAPGGLMGHAARLSLDGSRSTAAGVAVSSARWTQVSGPVLDIGGADTLTPQIGIAGATNDAGVAVLELEVRNAAGELDKERVEVLVINERAASRVFRYIDPLTGRAIWATDFTTNRPARFFADLNVIDVIFGFNRVLVGKSLPWAAGQVLPLGPDSGTNSVLNVGDGICVVQSGSINVLEFAVAADSTLAQLALDITATCDNGQRRNIAVRVNSTATLPF